MVINLCKKGHCKHISTGLLNRPFILQFVCVKLILLTESDMCNGKDM